MKFAYFVRPHLGGTYSVFRHLREGLSPHGVEVQWVGLGTSPSRGEPIGEEALKSGFYVFPHAPYEREQAAALMETLEDEGFDGVFINVLAERLQMNIARYLPEHMLRIMIVHSITPATYAAARSIRDCVHATVAVSERSRDDLIGRHGFSPRRIRTIANAVDVAAIARVPRPERPANILRLVFLGRIEDASKGVFWLPRILDELPESVRLTVAGDGPDLPALRTRLEGYGDRVTILGAVGSDEVAGLLARHDVLIMPSRFEGFGITIIEAMAAGCVPVVSRISGVTDSVVTDGVSGLLFPVGEWREAARHVKTLERRPSLLAEMSRNAHREAGSGFDIKTMADAYFRLIKELNGTLQPISMPLSLDSWSVPAGFRPGLRTFLPRPVKNWLRAARERM